MCLIPSAGVGLAIERFDAHLLHQRTDVFATDLDLLQPQHARSGKGRFQVQFVDPPHQPKIVVRCRLGQVIHGGSGKIEELYLLDHRQFMGPIDHRFALASPIRPSAPAKKLISSACCPIFACRSLRSGPAACFSATVAKTPEALSSNCVFHCVIWFGWTSNFSANAAKVSSPLRAAIATLALKAACGYGGVFSLLLLLAWRFSSPIEAEISFIQLSDFPGTLSDKAYDSDAILDRLYASNIEAVIPPRRNRCVQREFDKHRYKSRNLVERFFCRIKQFRRIATRYDKLAQRFSSFVAFTASVIWLA